MKLFIYNNNFSSGIDSCPEMEFKEFKPRFKSAKTRFKFSAGLNLETFYTILSETNQYLNRVLNLNRRSNSSNSANDL